ncbi:MAG: hypothetical protein LBL45_09245 [Treponema sp.]|nr:hypothetical protein [Treponema sp.]
MKFNFGNNHTGRRPARLCMARESKAAEEWGRATWGNAGANIWAGREEPVTGAWHWRRRQPARTLN